MTILNDPKISGGMKNNILLKSALVLAIVDLVLIVAILLQVNNLVKEVLELQNKQLEIEGMKEKLEKAKKEEVEEKPKEAADIKDSLTIDPETGWQVYRNETRGYEIRIPQDWVVKEKWPNLERISFITLSQKAGLSITTPLLGWGADFGDLKSKEVVQIGDTVGIKELYGRTEDGNEISRSTVIRWEERSKKPNSGIIIFSTYGEHAKNENLFNQMLKTFKFID